MLSRRTLAVLAVLCLAISLVARALDQHLLDAHAVMVTAATASQDPTQPAVRLWMNYDAITHNPVLIDAVSIVSLVLGIGFALTALWKHLT